MPTFQTTGCELYYDDEGAGRPVVFIPGFTCTVRFFDHQRDAVSSWGRFLVVDPRSHGRSEKLLAGNTVRSQTQDIHDLLEGLDLNGVVLVGWSNGAFNVWQYFADHGADRLAGVVLVDESPCPVSRDDWQLGYFDLPSLVHAMEARQTDSPTLVRQGFLPRLFTAEQPGEVLELLAREVLMMPPAIAAAVGLDSMGRDYRPMVGGVTTPALVCSGAKSFVAPGNHEWIVEHTPSARGVVFDNSGHMPFWEEADRFNEELAGFVSALG